MERGGFKTIALDHVLILLLPPNTTSMVQPLGAGIIAAWKTAFRTRLIKWQMKELETAAGLADVRPSGYRCAACTIAYLISLVSQ